MTWTEQLTGGSSCGCTAVGTVVSVDPFTVHIDGQVEPEAADQIRFSNYIPCVQDRVGLLRFGSAWVVVGRMGIGVGARAGTGTLVVELRRSAGFSIGTGTTLVTWDSAPYLPFGGWAAGSRFVAPFPGRWGLEAQIQTDAVGTAGKTFVGILKNGSTIAAANPHSPAGGSAVRVQAVGEVYLNGVSDYIEVAGSWPSAQNTNSFGTFLKATYKGPDMTTEDGADVPEGSALFPVASVRGAWTWFHEPPAVRSGTRTWFTRSFNSDVYIVQYDDSTRQVVGSQLVDYGTAADRDDHNVGSIGVRPDGRLLTATAGHGTNMTVRISDNAYDASTFGSPITAATGTLTYPNLFYLTSTSTWWLFYRHKISGGVGQWKYVTSTDNGATWSAQTVLVDGSGVSRYPYMKIWSDGVSKIHFQMTDGHPTSQSPTSIRHFYYDAGTWRNSAGTSLGALPLVPSSGTLVYDGAANDPAWCWSTAIDSNGRPVFVFATFPDTATDHRYQYARWDGSAWQVNQITPAGGNIDTTGLEPNYSGGVTLDKANPNIVYLSRQIGSSWELSKWTTSNNGVSWTSEALTQNTQVKNCRPWVVHGDTRVIYWSGRYDHFQDYDTNVLAFPPLRV